MANHSAHHAAHQTPATPTRSTRGRRASLAATAGAIPLGISLLAGSLFPSGSATTPPSGAGKMPTLACTLPFDSIKQHHPIDDACGPDGKGQPGSPQALQNDVKNNFCPAEPAVNVTIPLLRQLQQDVVSKQISFGSDSSLPTDRSALRTLSTPVGAIGEGRLVRLAAYVIDAHYSNLGKGESVNCKRGDQESNDIHIVLGETSNHDDECTSSTAEMSPHFRPDIWTPESLKNNKEHMFRFTGQLFFDASHSPCSGGTGSPKRSTLWEIHPVLAVDICTATSCTVDNDQGWESLTEFLSGGKSSETRLRLPPERLQFDK